METKVSAQNESILSQSSPLNSFFPLFQVFPPGEVARLRGAPEVGVHAGL